MEENVNKMPEEINEAQEAVQNNSELSENGQNSKDQEVDETVNSDSDGTETQAETTQVVASGSNQNSEVPKADAETDLETSKSDESANNEAGDGLELKTQEQAEVVSEKEEDTVNESDADEDGQHEDETLLESLQLEGANKEEILEALNQVSNMTQMRVLDKALKEIGPLYNQIFDAEKDQAKEAFLSEENAAEDFQYKGDETDQAYFALFEKLRHKKHKFFSELEKSKDENLKRKEETLEKLRELVDGEESTTSINAVKALQEEWKSIGHVPAAYVKTLWASYNALMDRFYDNRSIYFELKELDRKKNLEAKQELCSRAEALAKSENLSEAIVQLNELHEEYKHLGPVPKDIQEELWQRFKAASDEIYSRRKDYYDGLKSELAENAEKKIALAEEVAKLVAFSSDKISDWNKKTKELLELQKKWEAIGGLPRDRSKAINKQFWGGFKQFFSNKNAFFKSLEGQREENLKKKEELLSKAIELKSSDDWEKTANEFKRLQNQWRDIGPVPDKVRNEVYKKFKKACDEFFDRKRANGSVQEKEFEKNLEKKEEICSMLEAYINSDTIELSEVYDLFGKFSSAGFVPRGAIKKIQARFDAIVEKLLQLKDLSDTQRVEIQTQLELSKMKGGGNSGHKLHKMESTIRRKIGDLENDIATWNTNLDFFAASKTADKLRADFDKKIESANVQIAELKKQLKLLKQA
ncbi:MAG: DUF349 domain-containing protein [Cyclobacteriaceae bacterium]